MWSRRKSTGCDALSVSQMNIICFTAWPFYFVLSLDVHWTQVSFLAFTAIDHGLEILLFKNTCSGLHFFVVVTFIFILATLFEDNAKMVPDRGALQLLLMPLW